jgi:hypothetical protein
MLTDLLEIDKKTAFVLEINNSSDHLIVLCAALRLFKHCIPSCLTSHTGYDRCAINQLGKTVGNMKSIEIGVVFSGWT